ncbi:hypothetical protein G9A89_012725 [Geosiphon pyriformis]|nr:hypothetical protein G9A89_012725 [Geosiphon pyriformis]
MERKILNQPKSLFGFAFIARLLKVCSKLKCEAPEFWTLRDLFYLFSRRNTPLLAESLSHCQSVVENLVKKRFLETSSFYTDDGDQILVYSINPIIWKPIERLCHKQALKETSQPEQSTQQSFISGTNKEPGTKRKLLKFENAAVAIDSTKPISSSDLLPFHSNNTIDSSKTLVSSRRATFSKKSLSRPFRPPFKKQESLNSPSSISLRTSKFQSPLNLLERYPEVKVLTNQKTKIEQDIGNVEDTIRKIRTVLKYKEKDEDFILDELIIKWRHASQQAAEFLFSKFREHQTSLQHQTSYSSAWGLNNNWGWDDNSEENSQNFLDYDDHDDRNCHSRDVDEESDTTKKDDESFQNVTMKSMLTRLGVDLALISWDEDEECFH